LQFLVYVKHSAVSIIWTNCRGALFLRNNTSIDIFLATDSEDELWAKLCSSVAESFGITSCLYGFTHARHSLNRIGATTSMIIKHNYPAAYMQHFDESTFLDNDSSFKRMVDGEPFCLWTDSVESVVWDGAKDEHVVRNEIDQQLGMLAGVSIGFSFAGNKGFSGIGLAAQNSTAQEFINMWNKHSDELRAFVAQFDKLMRPCMVKNRFKLTPREKDVLAYSACGMGAKAIATQLGIQEKSVFNVLERARKSLSASNSMEAIAKAYTYDLL
jgi:DNA-binding CsgD family transcriptional regulator